MIIITTIIAILALALSFANFWYAFMRRGKLLFVCSSFTALGMRAPDGIPRAAFAVKISAINDGKRPIIIRDLFLRAEYSAIKQRINYNPVLLYDFQKSIEYGKDPTSIGKAQQGQVPIPVMVSPSSVYDFKYHILFLTAEDEADMIKPINGNSVIVKIFSLIGDSNKYKLIGEQIFNETKMKELKPNNFIQLISDEALDLRQKHFSES